MGNENSTGQNHQRPGLWMLARKGDASALLAGIARIPPEHKASYLNWTDEFGHRTPVAMATVLDYPECVKVLLEAGADANKIGGDGMGPLDLAVQANNVAIATLLLESPQLKCNVVDARGFTPLLAAAADGQPQVLDVLLHCERVDLFACQSKTGLDVLGIVRKAYSKASSKDRPRYKACLGLVEKRLVIRCGHLYEFVNSKAAKKWVWERRNYQVFCTADSRLAKIDFCTNNSELPSVEMIYLCLESNQKSDISELGLNKMQALFTEREHRFALRANITHKKRTVIQVFECAASNADDLAFWTNLPENLRSSRYSVLDSTRSSIISGREEPQERPQEPQERPQEPRERPQEPRERPQEPREEPSNQEPDLQTLQRQSDLLQQQLRRLQEDQKRLLEQEERKRRQQELEEQQRIERELEEQQIQREEELQRLQQEQLEQLVQERLQQRLEQEREERRMEQERLELMIQERQQQEQEEQRQQQERMEQMRIQLEELEQREMERVMQLSLDEASSHPSAPAFENVYLAAAQEPMDSKSTECLVCYDAVRNAVCVPCGHVSMCMDCAKEIKRSSKKCIVCRANIGSVVKIFHA